MAINFLPAAARAEHYPIAARVLETIQGAIWLPTLIFKAGKRFTVSGNREKGVLFALSEKEK